MGSKNHQKSYILHSGHPEDPLPADFNHEQNVGTTREKRVQRCHGLNGQKAREMRAKTRGTREARAHAFNVGYMFETTHSNFYQ